MKRWVTNDVWRELDPVAGRLSRRSIRRLRAGAVVTIVSVVLGALGWRSGVVVPHLVWPGDNDGGYSWSVGPSLVSHEVVIANKGWTSMTVVGIGRSEPGLQLVAIESTMMPVLTRAGDPEPPPASAAVLPAEIRPGGLLRVRAIYRITDCTAIPTGPWPVPVRVKRSWGVQTVYIGLPTQTRNAPSYYSYVDGHDPYAVEWQRAISAELCHFG